MKPAWQIARSALAVVICLWPALCVISGPARAQLQSQSGGYSSSQSSGDDNSNTSTSAAPANSTQNSFLSSLPEGKATGDVLQLSFKDAIERALKNNLGLLLASDSSLAARGAKWQELSHLLPNISAAATQSAAQVDLAALGFRLNFPGIPTVIGPVGIFDARGY